MNIRPVGAELFSADGRTDRQRWWILHTFSLMVRCV